VIDELRDWRIWLALAAMALVLTLLLCATPSQACERRHAHHSRPCACHHTQPVKGVFFRLPRCFGPLSLCGYDR
jgi:hypothetical protein